MTYRNIFYYTIIFTLLTNAVFSQSLQDLQKLKSEYEKIKNQQISLPPANDLGEQNIFNDFPVNQNILTKTESNFSDSAILKSRHYGYDFFVQRDSLSFYQNLPAPKEYLLGPGDQLIVSLWGETELRKSYTINRDGKIYDEKVGQLYLTGKSVEETKKFLKISYGSIYATLVGNNPSTYIDVSLGKLQSINVNFVGEVRFPGVYTIHPFSNLITGLIQSGGVDTTGTLREIVLKRNGKLYRTVDLYNYLLKGDFPKKIQLKDQDIVFVPPRLSTVTVDSAVYRPGIYEGKKNETVHNLINYAGGFKPNASKNIGLFRIKPINERTLSEPKTSNFYLNTKEAENTIVKDGDIVSINFIAPTNSKVELIGQVKHPGIYYFYEGMRVLDLLELGAGFEDTTFIKSIYMDNAEIIRRDPSNQCEKIINVNLNDLKRGVPEENKLLSNLDRFVVHANYNFFEQKNVQILGEVKIPGSYPLIKDKETLKSLIERSGGLTSKALEDGISIFREKKFFDKGIEKMIDEKSFLLVDPNSQDLNNTYRNQNLNNAIRISKEEEEKWIRVAWQNERVPLMPGDSVVVKRSTGTVMVSGKVYNPGFIEYQKNKSLGYYLEAAGGVTKKGDKKDVIVKYANGVVSPKKFLSYPRIKDGSTIIVNQKDITQKFNIAEFATNTLSIISTTVTILVLSSQINSN